MHRTQCPYVLSRRCLPWLFKLLACQQVLFKFSPIQLVNQKQDRTAQLLWWHLHVQYTIHARACLTYCSTATIHILSALLPQIPIKAFRVFTIKILNHTTLHYNNEATVSYRFISASSKKLKNFCFPLFPLWVPVTLARRAFKCFPVYSCKKVNCNELQHQHRTMTLHIFSVITQDMFAYTHTLHTQEANILLRP